MPENSKTPKSTTALWMKQNQRRWIPAAVIIAIVIAIVLFMVFSPTDKKKDKGDYMKLLQDRQDENIKTE